MHRLLTLALTIVLLSSPAFGQAPPPPGGDPIGEAQPDRGLLAKGIKVGLNIADVVGDGSGDPDSRTGFGAGAFIVYGLGGNLALQLEGLYMQQGASGNFDGTDVTFAYDYIQVPVLGRMSFPTGGQFKPYVAGGLSLGVLLLAEGRANGESVDIEDTTSFDVSVVAGAGAEVPAGQGAVFAELRYMRGLLKIDSSDSEFEAYNSVISIFAGYSF